MKTRRANSAARMAGAVVFCLGMLIVVKPAIDHIDQLWKGDPFARGTVSTVTETSSAGKSARTTTTKAPSDPFLERALGDSGVLLARIGIAALAAFLAGAVVQRILLAQFAIKIGPFELPDLQEAARSSDEASERLTKGLSRLKRRTVKQQQELRDLKAGAAKDAENLAELASRLAELTRRVEEMGLE